MKTAVCALIENPESKDERRWLLVSRPGNNEEFGLPGGKTEIGELLEEANEIFVSMFGIDEGPTINDIVKNKEESERERII